MIKLHLVVIRSSKLDELLTLYKMLGLRFEFHKHRKGPMHYSSNTNGLVFELYPLLKGQKKADDSTRLGFEVTNLNLLIEKLDKQGVEIIQYPMKTIWGDCAVIKDCDGRKIELLEKKN